MRRPLALAVAAVVVLVGVAVALWLTRGTDPADETPRDEPSVAASPTGRTTPPAPASVEPTDDAAAPSPDASPDPGQTPADPRARADVVLTFLEWDDATRSVQASGYSVPLEEGGTCRLTLTGPDGRTVTAESEAVPDVASVACGGLSVPRERLTPGAWSATLVYESSTSVGESDVREVSVP